jgi:hypothetical protein
VIHDENCNGELDTNLFGIPTEGYGFSSGAEVTMSALRFLMLYFHMMEDIFKCLYLLTIKFHLFVFIRSLKKVSAYVAALKKHEKLP